MTHETGESVGVRLKSLYTAFGVFAVARRVANYLLQTVTWDGRSDGGTRLVDGKYEFAINAKDLRGQAMSVKTGYSGVVDGFDLSSNGIILRAGAVRIPVSDVTGVRAK